MLETVGKSYGFLAILGDFDLKGPRAKVFSMFKKKL